MSDNNSSNENSNSTAEQTVDPVHQLLQSNGGNSVPGQALTAEQRNERREALLKRQRESREKAQQISQAARANAATGNGNASISTSGAASVATASTPANAPAPAPVPAAIPPAISAPVPEAPVRENMIQQAVAFLSSPNVQSAEESKKIQFLEKKGLTAKEIELAKARVAAGKTTATTTANVAPHSQQQQQSSYQPSSAPASPPSSLTPPPVPPRTYTTAPMHPQPVLIPSQQVAPVDPNAFKRKLVIAMILSGGITVLATVLIQKLLYPMVRGITNARQKLAISQTELLSKLKEKLQGYKGYLLGLQLGSNRFTPNVKKIKDTKTTVEDEEHEVESKDGDKRVTTTSVTTTTTLKAAAIPSTVKQLDTFSQKLEAHANSLNFEQLKATRAVTQDLAEYITKETYALTSSIAYPTSRYYGYNTAGAAASGKGGLSDPTSPESALKSEIRSLKGLLLNWRNFPTAKETGTGVVQGANGVNTLPNLVQQQ
ncbi:hypothetical protein BX616_000351 [Lobosporangium transversale]|uniref:Peroxisomal membrane protein PEX14 n=1 Tax=Lobosporangium transversale TaxID=64571 RepID=A0A1Y2GF05_9FUNG|nr:peroxisomal membrane anchor protein conserved region-domain-containing protein [Lobosporangium transversale]KAF9907702.1 hypothetical protein BX616_000351 [Lobosporangium transversale]ORZ09036.1 peroxisomal membrane anchor protein conserved region-domain-containing protein [Lobosporangium transversale]|eukprot:XP_021878663.1 peroxisomal membrane anchor protein conserved region-domain-containing protein [Lobosporangium transversale]